MKKISILLILLSLCQYKSTAKNGDIDSTFGTNGRTLTGFAKDNGYITDIAIQNDNKIIAAGYFTFYTTTTSYTNFTIARYNSSGVLDSTFGVNGVDTMRVGDYSVSNTIAIQSDGKIIAAGTAKPTAMMTNEFCLVRYNTDGSIDSTFGNAGITYTLINNYAAILSIAIQPDGKIVTAGYSSILSNQYLFTLARYQTNGSLDSSFGTDGIVTTKVGINSGISSIQLQSDGKIIAGGRKYSSVNYKDTFALARYNTDGALDHSFGSSGIVISPVDNVSGINSIAIQPDGKIVAGGAAGNMAPATNFALVRYNTDGSTDNSFGDHGKVITHFSDINTSSSVANVILLQPDGKILAGGTCDSDTYNYAFCLSRYESDGSLDTSFGDSGKVIGAIEVPVVTHDDGFSSIKMQQDGKIICGGYAEDLSHNQAFLVARYISGLRLGIVKLIKGANTLFVYPNPIQQNATLKYTLIDNETISASLMDMQGKLVKAFINNQKETEGNHELSVSMPETLPAGSYFIVLSSAKGGRASVQVVKK